MPVPSQIDNATGLLLFLSPREDGTLRETDKIGSSCKRFFCMEKSPFSVKAFFFFQS